LGATFGWQTPKERSVTPIDVLSPMRGWLMPLTDVPDGVFSAGLAGPGVAIEPIEGRVYAPCGGVVVRMQGGPHAVTIRGPAGDILVHIGIDSVALGGEGFRHLVEDGERICAGQPLVDFDLTAVARRATSAISPVLLVGSHDARLRHVAAVGRVKPGDRLYAVELSGASTAVEAVEVAATSVGRFRVPFDHGLHARPAAQLVAALAPVPGAVVLRAGGRRANARSPLELMALGIARGDVVEFLTGASGVAPLRTALAGLLEAVTEDVPPVSLPGSASSTVCPGSVLPAVIASRGLAVGRAHWLATTRRSPGVARGESVTEGEALRVALERVDTALARLEGRQVSGGVVAAHRALLADPVLRGRAHTLILQGASAGAAWVAAIDSAAVDLAAGGDVRMAERRADLVDLEQQVLAVLDGAEPFAPQQLPNGSIVLADDLLPSQFLCLDPERVAGIATAGGGPTSHVAILAAARGLPMLVAVGASLGGIAAGVEIILDAEAGRLLLASDAAAMEEALSTLARRRAEDAADRDAALDPAVTCDGQRVHVYANLGRGAEAGSAVALGAEGCGLLRTEFLFLDRSEAPTVDEQSTEYRRVALGLGARALTIRTLDAGGDKPIAYLRMPREENPALGLRGLRTGQLYPELLGEQIEAILDGAGGHARVLLPMVTEPDEVRVVRDELSRRAARRGVAVPALGVMIETPAAALLAASFAGVADFLSIGSNDLAQYTLAMDRLHPALAPRLDGLHPAVLRLIGAVASAGAAAGLEVGVCGALASDPEALPILVGLGVRELSVVPAMIPRMKRLIRALDASDCGRAARQALAMTSAGAVRELVRRRADSSGAQRSN
jgi:multiphosphoryl transfer protein